MNCGRRHTKCIHIVSVYDSVTVSTSLFNIDVTDGFVDTTGVKNCHITRADAGKVALVVVVNYCFTSLFDTNGHLSDIVIRQKRCSQLRAFSFTRPICFFLHYWCQELPC